MEVTKHLFKDGEKVRIKETGEVVTVDHWWYASNTGWEVQYSILEYPATWYFEHELEKIS